MNFEYYIDLNNLQDIQYYLSIPHFARDIENDFFIVAEHLIKKNSLEAFDFFLKHFYHKIVDGDYRPSPAYDIIFDLFLLAAKYNSYPQTFKILFDNNYNPNIEEKKIGHGELISYLFEEQFYEQIRFLTKHKYIDSSISLNDHCNYFYKICSNKSFEKLQSFNSFNISFTGDNEKYKLDNFFIYLFDNINDKNFNDFCKMVSFFENSNKYKEHIFSFYQNFGKEQIFLKIFNQDYLSFNNLKYLKNLLNVNEFILSKDDINNTFIHHFYKSNKIKFLTEFYPELFKQNLEVSNLFYYNVFKNIPYNRFHLLDKIQKISNFSFESFDKKQQEILTDKFFYSYVSKKINNEQFNSIIEVMFKDKKSFNLLDHTCYSYLSTIDINHIQHILNAFFEKNKILQVVNQNNNSETNIINRRRM